MKQIKLPISQTVSTSFTFEELASRVAIPQLDGTEIVSLGTLIDPEISAEMSQARNNGGILLYATTSIEQLIEGIILRYFMGSFDEPDDRRTLFKNELLQSSILSFRDKKELLAKILNKTQHLNGKEKNRIQSYLADIMKWRNAFAHGKVQHDSHKKCFIKYYSSGATELQLNDELWCKVEETFSDGTKLLEKVIQRLENT